MKLAVNTLFGIQVAVLAELFGMLSRNGISSAKVMECLENLPVLSMAAKGAGGLMVSQNHTPLFPIKVEKDFLLCCSSWAKFRGNHANLYCCYGYLSQCDRPRLWW